MVGVEVRQETLGVDGRGCEPEQDEEEEGGRKEKEGGEATNIKSNNPHLADGEILWLSRPPLALPCSAPLQYFSGSGLLVLGDCRRKNRRFKSRRQYKSHCLI